MVIVPEFFRYETVVSFFCLQLFLSNATPEEFVDNMVQRFFCWLANFFFFSLCMQGGTTQMRFQPRHGRYLAAAAENTIGILDVETQARRHLLQVGCLIWNIRYAMEAVHHVLLLICYVNHKMISQVRIIKLRIKHAFS